MSDTNVKEIKPQKGPQERFLSTSADIAIYGGAAGGGKTYGLLLNPLRYIMTDGFNGVIFRRDYVQITAAGGLWDESQRLYSEIPKAKGSKSPKYHWMFGKQSTVWFDYIGRDEDVNKWQGSQITMIGFDELTHFSEYTFFYMLSRNRSTCGVKPFIRATCNPDSDSWVAKFIEWWIDQESGYPIAERSGKIRFFVRINEVLYWFDSRPAAVEYAIKNGTAPEEAVTMPKSVTFIASTLQDNQILMKRDPGYLANLQAMPLVERERLLRGNWKIKPRAGLFFKRTQIGDFLQEIPKNLTAVCRGWDLAATDRNENQDAAFTAGVLIGRTSEGRFVVLDVINQQIQAGEVRTLIQLTAKLDRQKYGNICPVRQRLPQDPGQAGKEQAQSYIRLLAGYDVQIKPESGDKVTRAEPMAAQWQHGLFDLMEADWNETYLNQLESFPDGKWKDMVDAGSSAFSELTLYMGTVAGGLVYGRFSDNSRDIDFNAKMRRRFGLINIGLVFGANGFNQALVATTDLDDYGSMMVLGAVQYSDNTDTEIAVSRTIEFINNITGQYGRVISLYCPKGEITLRRDLKNALSENDYGNIRVGASLGISNKECIDLENKLLVNDRLFMAAGACQDLKDALISATWDKDGADRAADSAVIKAFEYSFEGDIRQYIDGV